MAQQAATLEGWRPSEREHIDIFEHDIPVRNTFIHFDDNTDSEDSLPSFSQHTLSSPAALPGSGRSLSSAGEDGKEEAESQVGGRFAEAADPAPARRPRQEETLGSSRALHRARACVPCAYFVLRDACRKGSECNRCHFCTKRDLQRWKKASKRAKAAALKPSFQVTAASGEEAQEEEAHEKPDSVDGTSDDSRRPFMVKNTFVHCCDEDEPSLPMRKCKSDPGPYSTLGSARQLELFNARLSDLLADSKKNDSPRSRDSSCSTTLGSSALRRSHSHGTTTSSTDSVVVPETPDHAMDSGNALDQADDAADEADDALDRSEGAADRTQDQTSDLETLGTPTTNLETRGVSFETHLSVECQPCFYFSFKPDGCRKGADCIYCHFCSNKESKQRKRSSRALAKRLRRGGGASPPSEPAASAAAAG